MISRLHGQSRSPLIDAAEAFRLVLDQAKADAGPVHFEWYPYDSLANMLHLTRLLEGSAFDFESVIRNRPVLDLGCSDGLFAFFLESLGAQVVAVDHPRTNHNNLAGIRTLKQQLNSRVDVRTMDLDAGLALERGERFELVLALGLLYHLKNPFQFLENLAMHARYAIVSTRVMRRLPGMHVDISALPLSYLLGADELNGDNSNFWIFTEAALRRLFQRAHWRVLAWYSVGDTEASLPHTLDHDERVFCLVESTWGDMGMDLGEGWHQPEDSGWRWTGRCFAARARPGQSGAFTASIFVPGALLKEGPVTLAISADGRALPPETFTAEGLYTVRRETINASQLAFELSRALPPEPGDPRERGVIVESLKLG